MAGTGEHMCRPQCEVNGWFNEHTRRIQPAFDIDLPGYRYIGRGPDATGQGGGWHRSERLYFRCIKCGKMMPSVLSENWQCPCGIDGRGCRLWQVRFCIRRWERIGL